MSNTKDYYSVELTGGEYDRIIFYHGKPFSFSFDDPNDKIAIKRQKAVDKFIEIYKGLSKGEELPPSVKLLQNVYFTDYDFDYGTRVEIEGWYQTPLFELLKGQLKIYWQNWSDEARYYNRATLESTAKGWMTKKVRAKHPDGSIFEVFDDKLCQALNIDYEYFEWD